jgi:subtilisin family serine protease
MRSCKTKSQTVAALVLAASMVCYFAPHQAIAGSSSRDSRDRDDKDELRRSAERAQETARQQQEQAAEQLKKNQEPQSFGGKDQAASSVDANKSGATDDKNSDGKRAAADAIQDSGKRGQIEQNKVPTTVAEWLQGVFKPAVPPAAPSTKNVGTPPAKTTPPAATKPILTTGPTPAKPQKPVPGKQASRDSLPSFPAQRPEVLAGQMTPKSVERAVALGFRVNGSAGVSRVNLNLTRLIAPEGISAEQARDLLRQAMPGETFGINQTYRIYRTATGALPAAQSGVARPPVSMATPCGTDRCFGASIIRWQSALQSCSRDVKIGVIDTGYDASHPAFRSRVIEARRSSTSDHIKSPDWHGTGVLALLAGDAKSDTPGLVPDSKFYLADIFYAGTDGLPTSDTASLLDALDWLEKRNVNIINMSLSGPPDDLLKTAIEGLSHKKGIIFVAAAGNDGPSAPPTYPAAYDPVIAVTAVSRDLRSYRYANRGDHIDIAAPGVDIWTASPGGQAAYHSGTSFAVPYVTAVLATTYKGLAIKNKAEFFKRATVQDLGEPGRDPIYGRGLLMAPASCSPEIPAPPTGPALASMPVTSAKAPLAAPSGLTLQAQAPR